jgi:hypothetical protein
MTQNYGTEIGTKAATDVIERPRKNVCQKCGGSGVVVKTSGPLAFRRIKCACQARVAEGGNDN